MFNQDGQNKEEDRAVGDQLVGRGEQSRIVVEQAEEKEPEGKNAAATISASQITYNHLFPTADIASPGSSQHSRNPLHSLIFSHVGSPANNPQPKANIKQSVPLSSLHRGALAGPRGDSIAIHQSDLGVVGAKMSLRKSKFWEMKSIIKKLEKGKKGSEVAAMGLVEEERAAKAVPQPIENSPPVADEQNLKTKLAPLIQHNQDSSNRFSFSNAQGEQVPAKAYEDGQIQTNELVQAEANLDKVLKQEEEEQREQVRASVQLDFSKAVLETNDQDQKQKSFDFDTNSSAGRQDEVRRSQVERESSRRNAGESDHQNSSVSPGRGSLADQAQELAEQPASPENQKDALVKPKRLSKASKAGGKPLQLLLSQTSESGSSSGRSQRVSKSSNSMATEKVSEKLLKLNNMSEASQLDTEMMISPLANLQKLSKDNRFSFSDFSKANTLFERKLHQCRQSQTMSIMKNLQQLQVKKRKSSDEDEDDSSCSQQSQKRKKNTKKIRKSISQKKKKKTNFKKDASLTTDGDGSDASGSAISYNHIFDQPHNHERYEYFTSLKNQNRKKKDASQELRQLVQQAKEEEVVDIMLSDEERESEELDAFEKQFTVLSQTFTRKMDKISTRCPCPCSCKWLWPDGPPPWSRNGASATQKESRRFSSSNKSTAKKSRKQIAESTNASLRRSLTWREVIHKKDDSYELEYKKLLSQGIIKQDHPLRKKWDVLIIAFSLYNCIELPMEAAFDWRALQDTYSITERLNHVIDFMFFIDIVMNFRTTYFNARTGEEIIDKHQISKHYLKGHFIIDLLSTIPFDVIYDALFHLEDESSNHLQIMSMMKIIRVLRLSRLITYLNSAEDIKLSLRLIQTIFLIFLYIHITACLWFMIIKSQRNWEPSQGLDKKFMEYGFSDKFFITIYQSILALCGNDIFPVSRFQFFWSCGLLLCGAMLQATMFGQVAGIVQSMNRKSQAFQERIDVANTSMKNMQLGETMQQNVREFMTKTQSNMNDQKELEEFLKILSPSMRVRVTNHIFEQAILMNPLFCHKMDVVEYIIDYIVPKLYLPEDQIISMGSKDKLIYFVANGNCQVSVSNHLKQIVVINELHQGDYFGEIAVIFGSDRTASIESINYCTLAHLSIEHFKELCRVCPEVYTSIKQRALTRYNDQWIQFKVVLLKQVDYFQVDGSEGIDRRRIDRFYREIQFYLEESIYQPGAEIIQVGDTCSAIMFIVNGLVDVEILDADRNKFLLDTLKQGDSIGQYSVLFGQAFEFNATARTHVRILTLSENFFGHFSHEADSGDKGLDGFCEAIDRAQAHVDQFDVPVCDFKIFDSSRACDHSCEHGLQRDSWAAFRRSVHRATQVAHLFKPKKNYGILSALKQLKEMQKIKHEINNVQSSPINVMEIGGRKSQIEQLQNDLEEQIKQNIDKPNERASKLERFVPKIREKEAPGIRRMDTALRQPIGPAAKNQGQQRRHSLMSTVGTPLVGRRTSANFDHLSGGSGAPIKRNKTFLSKQHGQDGQNAPPAMEYSKTAQAEAQIGALDPNVPDDQNQKTRRTSHSNKSKKKDLTTNQLNNIYIGGKHRQHTQQQVSLLQKWQVKAGLNKMIINGVNNVFADAQNINVMSLTHGKGPKPSQKQKSILQQMRDSQILSMKQIAFKVLVREQQKQEEQALRRQSASIEQSQGSSAFKINGVGHNLELAEMKKFQSHDPRVFRPANKIVEVEQSSSSRSQSLRSESVTVRDVSDLQS